MNTGSNDEPAMAGTSTPLPPSMHPSIGVVIATRDRPEMLRRAIDAVLAQEYPGDVECIVVFDQAPVDPTVAAPAAGRAGRSVRVLPNARTPGLAGARNTGIDASTTELIAFCDDDDAWLPAKLRAQVDLLHRSAGKATPVDVVVTGINVHYEDHVVARVPKPADLTVAELARRRVAEAHPSTVLVRADALRNRIGLVDEDIPGCYGEDFDWLLRAAQTGTIGVVSQPLVDVRWGSQSYFQERWQIIVESIDYGLAKHPVLSESRPGHARLLGRKAFAYAALGARRRALSSAWRCWRRSVREPRSYLATLIALRLLSADRALRLAHSRGRGI